MNCYENEFLTFSVFVIIKYLLNIRIKLLFRTNIEIDRSATNYLLLEEDSDSIRLNYLYF